MRYGPARPLSSVRRQVVWLAAAVAVLAPVELPLVPSAFVARTSNGSSSWSASSAFPPTYAGSVKADSPWLYYRLGETCGTTAADSSGNARPGTYRSGVTLNATGALGRDSDPAASFDGVDDVVTNATASSAPQVFTAEAWFRTTTTRGGKIVGYEDSSTATSGTNADRHVYMTSAGRLVFGVYTGSYTTVQTSSAYNDGGWHHVVATMSGAGMRLYVDGALAGSNTTASATFTGTGYWRVGQGNLLNWPSRPTSDAFTGSIDEVAVYLTALSATRVLAHYTEGRPYPATVTSGSPTFYWRLGDAAGATSAADTSGNSRPGTVYGGVTFGQAGVVPTDPNAAATFDGSSGLVVDPTPVANPGAFTLELWFRTTTTTGGKLIGFESSATDLDGGSDDRHVYMTDAGRLVFGTFSSNQVTTVTTSSSYNDGVWHLVTATQGSAGMALYVDGALAGTDPATTGENVTGYWRVGNGNLVGWPSSPTSEAFAGTLDEVAVYTTALPATQVVSRFSQTRPYRAVVTADGPFLYHRLGDSGCGVAADSSGNARPGTYYGAVSSTTGAITNDADLATSFTGSAGSVVVGGTRVSNPTTYSLEAWVKTSTTSGGRIIGFEDSTNATVGVNYDRVVYLRNDGTATFGVYTGGANVTLTSTTSVNNGAWHLLTATQGSAGMRLYVDGALVASNATASAQNISGYWRVGDGNLSGWPGQPSSSALAGALDEAAVYPAVLTAGQVAAHYRAR